MSENSRLLRVSMVAFGLFPASKVIANQQTSPGQTTHSSPIDLPAEQSGLTGLWWQCLAESGRYVELELRQERFIKRVVYLDPNASSHAEHPCAGDHALAEVTASGPLTMESRGDNGRLSLQLVHQNFTYEFYQQHAALMANGFADSAQPAVCGHTTLPVGKAVSVSGDYCRQLLPGAPRRFVGPYAQTLEMRRIGNGRLQVPAGIWQGVFQPDDLDRMYALGPDGESMESRPTSRSWSAARGLPQSQAELDKFLQGEWTSCQGFRRITLVFDEGAFVREHTRYETRHCISGSERYRETHVGTYRLQGFDSSLPGAFRIDWLKDDFRLEPMSRTYADMINAEGVYSQTGESYCEAQQFRVGEATSLVGRLCDFNGEGYQPVRLDPLYDLMLVHENGKLFDSNFLDGEGHSPDRRPSTINWDVSYQRVANSQ